MKYEGGGEVVGVEGWTETLTVKIHWYWITESEILTVERKFECTKHIKFSKPFSLDILLWHTITGVDRKRGSKGEIASKATLGSN